MKIKSLILGFSLLGAGVLSQADCGPSFCNMNPCNTSCCETDCCTQFYSGITGGYFHTGDINSGGGGIHLGIKYPMACLDLKQGFEIEVLVVGGSKTKNGTNQPNLAVDDIYNTHRKVSLTQVPVFFNYRLGSDFCCWPCLSWYAGAGLGFIWSNAKNERHFTQIEVGDVTEDISLSSRKNQTRFAGQLFAGLGYRITDCLTLDGNIRVMFSQSHRWNDIPHSDFVPETIRTSSAQLGLELGLSYGW